jgi:hypothetical protein
MTEKELIMDYIDRLADVKLPTGIPAEAYIHIWLLLASCNFAIRKIAEEME